jgi:hypothetical protein
MFGIVALMRLYSRHTMGSTAAGGMTPAAVRSPCWPDSLIASEDGAPAEASMPMTTCRRSLRPSESQKRAKWTLLIRPRLE